MVNDQEREQIFREVLREYEIQDAERQVREYIELNELESEFKVSDFDLDALAEAFECAQDCNVAENDTWFYVIEQEIFSRRRLISC